MRIKMTASVILLMAYVQFMAPFIIVPKNYTPRPPRRLKDDEKSSGISGLIDDWGDLHDSLNKNMGKNIEEAGKVAGLPGALIVIGAYAFANAIAFMGGLFYTIGGAMLMFAGYAMVFFYMLGEWLLKVCGKALAILAVAGQELFEAVAERAHRASVYLSKLKWWRKDRVKKKIRKLTKQTQVAHTDFPAEANKNITLGLPVLIDLPKWFSKERTEEMSQEEKLMFKKYENAKRVGKWVERVAQHFDLMNLEAQALGKSQKKGLLNLFGKSTDEPNKEPGPPMSDEELRFAFRRLYDSEQIDLENQAIELNGVPKMDSVQKDPKVSHFEETKIRRQGLKTRIGKIVDLVQTNAYNLKKYRASYPYKRILYPVEIDQIIARINDQKNTEDKQALRDKLQKIMEREIPGTSSTALNKHMAIDVNNQYIRAGLNKSNITMKFFSSYVRAAFICIIRLDIAKTEIYKQKNPGKFKNPESLKSHEDSIQKLHETVASVTKDVDFD